MPTVAHPSVGSRRAAATRVAAALRTETGLARPAGRRCVHVVHDSRTPENRPPTTKSPVFHRSPPCDVWRDETRIIQNEPEPEPSVETEAAAPVADEREGWLRRACFLVAVVGYIIIGVIHPAEIEVGDDTTLYIGIHLVQPFFILARLGHVAARKGSSRASCASGPHRDRPVRDRVLHVRRDRRRRAGRDRPAGERCERGRRRGRAATDGYRHGLRRRGSRGVGPVLVRHGPCRCHCRQADRRARPDAADGDRRGDLRHCPPPDRADRHHALRPRCPWLELRREQAPVTRRSPHWLREPKEPLVRTSPRNTTSRPGWATGALRTGRRRSSAGSGS